ncbi:MAG: hypothetical protein ACFCVE_13230 [Phycisphaerae bacterium]
MVDKPNADKTDDDIYDLADEDEAAARAADFARSASAVPPPTSKTPSMYHRPAPVKMKEPDKKAEFTKIGMIIGVVLLAGLAVWGVSFLGGGASEARADLKGDDAEVIRKIDRESGMEVREWLGKSHNYSIGNGNLNERQTEKVVGDWYEMGAKKVYAFGSGISMSVAIELPDAVEQRTAIFDWCNKRLPLGDPPKADEGQQYILFPLAGIQR